MYLLKNGSACNSVHRVSCLLSNVHTIWLAYFAYARYRCTFRKVALSLSLSLRSWSTTAWTHHWSATSCVLAQGRESLSTTTPSVADGMCKPILGGGSLNVNDPLASPWSSCTVFTGSAADSRIPGEDPIPRHCE